MKASIQSLPSGKEIVISLTHCSAPDWRTEKAKTIENKKYLIVPNGAVLVLVREGFDAGPDGWEGSNSN